MPESKPHGHHQSISHHHATHNKYQQFHQKHPVHHPKTHGHHAMRHLQLHPKDDKIPVVHTHHSTHPHDHVIHSPLLSPVLPVHTGPNTQGWHTFVPEYKAYTQEYLQHPDPNVVFGLNTPATMMYPNGIPTNHLW